MSMHTGEWRALRWALGGADVHDARTSPYQSFRVLRPSDIDRFDDALDYWDCWPLLTLDGQLYHSDDGTSLWFALAAPKSADPLERHAHARIHLLKRQHGRFQPLGPAMPDGHSPGSREWSGSATIDPQDGTVTLYFTATGRRDETLVTYEQRLFAARARLGADTLTDWQTPFELLPNDGEVYRVANETQGEIGTIKAFRDPEYFADPQTGKGYIVFTASSAANPGPYDGLVGLAALGVDGKARPLPPLIDASGFNNELERPHIRIFGGLYYLFWSTQAHVFNPDAPNMPTGLYGAVADSLRGPWRLVNGTGLVAANPAEEPLQAYSWIVLPGGAVASFVDYWGLHGRDARDPACMRAQFGGTLTPFAHLRFDGDTVWLADG